jgi:hypothetical protein
MICLPPGSWVLGRVPAWMNGLRDGGRSCSDVRESPGARRRGFLSPRRHGWARLASCLSVRLVKSSFLARMPAQIDVLIKSKIERRSLDREGGVLFPKSCHVGITSIVFAPLGERRTRGSASYWPSRSSDPSNIVRSRRNNREAASIGQARAPIMVLGWFELPPIWPENRLFSERMFAIHGLLGMVIAGRWPCISARHCSIALCAGIASSCA